MKFVEGLIDMDAAEYVVTGIANVERISRGMVRVTYTRRDSGENIASFHAIWDYDAYMAAQSLNDRAFVELRQEWIDRDASARAREMH